MRQDGRIRSLGRFPTRAEAMVAALGITVSYKPDEGHHVFNNAARPAGQGWCVGRTGNSEEKACVVMLNDRDALAHFGIVVPA